MAIPTRDQASKTLEEGQAALEALFGRLSDEEITRPATIGGGSWSAKDLMGHVAFWEELALDTLADWRAGHRPAVEQIYDEGAAGIDSANARNQARTAVQPLYAVRARATAAHVTGVQGHSGNVRRRVAGGSLLPERAQADACRTPGQHAGSAGSTLRARLRARARP
jgi:DinB family protein